jgi:hypothetical protein
MNSNNLWSLCFVFIAVLYISNAYAIKKNDEKRKQALSKVKVNKDKSVQTSRRTFKSVEGYLDFTFYDSLFGGVMFIIIAIPSYIFESPVFDCISTLAAIVIYTAFNFYLYSKLKDK